MTENIIEEIRLLYEGLSESQESECELPIRDACTSYETGFQTTHLIRSTEEERENWNWLWSLERVSNQIKERMDCLRVLKSDLSSQLSDVNSKCNSLRVHCEKLITDQQVVEHLVTSVEEKISIYNGVSEVARILESHASLFTDPVLLASVCDKINKGVGFFESHSDYVDAGNFLDNYTRLRARICSSVTSSAITEIEKLAETQSQTVEITHLSHFKLFGRLENLSLTLKPVTILLQANASCHADYSEAIEEIENFYSDQRSYFLGYIVSNHVRQVVASLVRGETNYDDVESLAKDRALVSATRQLCAQILAVGRTEEKIHREFFGDKFPAYIHALLGSTLSEALKEQIRSCDSPETLRDLAETLASDFLTNEDLEISSGGHVILRAIASLHEFVQSRLVERVEFFIKNDVESANCQGSWQEHLLQGQVHPCLSKMLYSLALILRAVPKRAFQRLANLDVRTCMTTLQREHVSDSKPEQLLFILFHFLLLREHVASFECDLVTYRGTASNDSMTSLLSWLVPSSTEDSRLDVRLHIEETIETTCNALIDSVAGELLEPLARGYEAEKLSMTVEQISRKHAVMIKTYLSLGPTSAWPILVTSIEKILSPSLSEELFDVVKAMFEQSNALCKEDLQKLFIEII